MENSKPTSSNIQILKNRKVQVLIVIIILILTAIIFTTRKPDVHVQRIRVKDFSTSEIWILFEVTLKVSNHNIIGGTLNSLEAEIFYNNEDIGHARTTEKYEIKPLGDSTLRVDLRIDNLPSSFTLIPRIRAKGTANVSVFFLSWDEDIDKEVFG